MNLSKEEFLKMQESALAHAKLMHNEAKKKNSNYDFENIKSPCNDKKEVSDSNSQRNILSSGCPDEKSNHNMFVMTNNNPLNDDTLLLTFILILIFDKADKILIFALMYIML